jgi:hypothetical protein
MTSVLPNEAAADAGMLFALAATGFPDFAADLDVFVFAVAAFAVDLAAGFFAATLFSEDPDFLFLVDLPAFVVSTDSFALANRYAPFQQYLFIASSAPFSGSKSGEPSYSDIFSIMNDTVLASMLH